MCPNDIQILETRRKEILSTEILTAVPLKVLKSLMNWALLKCIFNKILGT